MTQVDEIEKLQTELLENPRSLHFVRLAECYLEKDLITEAEALVTRSLKFHPNSVSGLLVLSRILKKLQKFDGLMPLLEKATHLAPENWQAWLQKAEIHAQLQEAKNALICFKKVLFLNPKHSFARRSVSKLEILTADDYEDDLFSMQPIHLTKLKNESTVAEKTDWVKIPGALERSLAFVDALTVRLDIEKAIELLNDCTKKYGSHPEIDSRRLRLTSYDKPDYILPKNQNKSSGAKLELIRSRKISVLQELLRRIELLQTDRLSTLP